MNPIVWGPHLWFFMHTLSFNYPDKPTVVDKENYSEFFINLTKTLPCDTCKKHYTEFVKKNPINTDSDSLKSNKQIIEWVLKLHNEVNKRNNKSEWSLDQLNKYYKKKYSQDEETNYLVKYANYIKFLLVLFLVIILLLKKYNKI